MEKEPKKRTITQNRALHLGLEQASIELNGKGIDRHIVIQDLEGYSAPITPEFLKEVFKEIMWTTYRKKSTTELTTNEMTTCWDVFALFMAENYGIHLTWPSNDALALQALLDSESI